MERKHKQYSDEFKLQVVKEYLEGNLGCRRLAQKYNLPSKNYILNWKDQLIKKGLLEDTHKKILKTLSNKSTKTAYEKQLEREIKSEWHPLQRGQPFRKNRLQDSRGKTSENTVYARCWAERRGRRRCIRSQPFQRRRGCTVFGCVH